MGNASFADRVRHTVKKTGASAWFLIATICFTLVQLIALLSLGSDNAAIYELFAAVEELGIDSGDLRELFSVVEDTSKFLGFLGMIPGLLVMSGLWAVYAASVSRDNRPGTAGMTIIFVITILELIGVCLVMLIAMLIIVAALSEANTYSSAIPEIEATQAVLVTVLVILAAVTVFILFYYIKICTTISRVKKTLRTGVPDRRVSGFVAVMCFIGGGSAALSGLGNFISASNSEVYEYLSDSVQMSAYLSAASGLLSGLAQIFIGVLIFQYKGKMSQLELEAHAVAVPAYGAPAYSAPVYNAPVYTQPRPAAPQPTAAPRPAAPRPAPVAPQSAPVAPQPAPVATPAPIAAPAPVAVPASVVAPEPVATPEPVAAPAPVAVPEPVVVPEPVAAPAPAAEEDADTLF